MQEKKDRATKNEKHERRQDKRRQEKPREDKARQDKIRQDKTRQDEKGPGKTRQDMPLEIDFQMSFD